MFNYNSLIEKALLGVVKNILRNVQKNGLAENQHFYISFKTNHPQVQVPSFLKREHPETITIVLQYEFDSLKVSNENFGVNLRFNNSHHFLHVPFEAIVAFSDPSEKFELFFSSAQNKVFKEDENPEIELPYEKDDEKIISLDDFRKKT
ncbi:MAG: ClpXP protease specificity-enhancing factor SspB [Alphaproteobacteria bacterium]